MPGKGQDGDIVSSKLSASPALACGCFEAAPDLFFRSHRLPHISTEAFKALTLPRGYRAFLLVVKLKLG
jgi:hypothetical protein